MNQQFYCLSSPLKARTSAPLYGTIEWYRKFQSAEYIPHTTNYEQSVCPTGHRIIGRRLGNLKLVLPTRHIRDFVWTVLGDCVVTEGVLTLFSQNGFTGVAERPATIEKVKRLRRDESFPIPKVWELEVVGEGGDAHPDSGIKLLHICTGCGAQVPLFFQEWNHSR